MEGSSLHLALGERVQHVRDGRTGIVFGAELSGKIKVQLDDKTMCNWQTQANFISLTNPRPTPVTLGAGNGKTVAKTPAAAEDHIAVLQDASSDHAAKEAAIDAITKLGRRANLCGDSLASQLGNGWCLTWKALKALKATGTAPAHAHAIVSSVDVAAQAPSAKQHQLTSALKAAITTAGESVKPFLGELVTRLWLRDSFDDDDDRGPSTNWRERFDEGQRRDAIREAAQEALGACAQHAEDVVPQVMERLRLSKSRERVLSLMLGSFRAHAAPHLDALIHAAGEQAIDSDDQQRIDAAYNLESLVRSWGRPLPLVAGQRARCMRLLKALLTDRNKDVREATATLVEEEEFRLEEADDVAEDVGRAEATAGEVEVVGERTREERDSELLRNAVCLDDDGSDGHGSDSGGDDDGDEEDDGPSTKRVKREISQRVASGSAAAPQASEGAEAGETHRTYMVKERVKERKTYIDARGYMVSEEVWVEKEVERVMPHLQKLQRVASGGMAPVAQAMAPPSHASGTAQKVAGLPMSELIKVIKELPQLKSQIQAIVSRKDLEEQHKMAEIQRIVREAQPGNP